jgi:ankyrin repeat protein
LKGETSCVECLMNYGAIYDTRDSINQRTPVHAAAYNNNTECLKILASITSDNDLNTDLTLETCYFNKTLSNLRDKHDRTALHVAVEQGHLNTIQFLLNQMGSDPLAFDNKKRTALHRAAALGYEEICLNILKSNQETAYQRDTHGLLPIHYAVMAGHSNLISLLFEYHESMNLEEVTSKKTTKKDKLVDRQGFSLLHLACFSGHLACVETICELGQTYPYLIEMLTNNSISIYNKFSPIHCACHNSHDTCLSYLFDRYNDKLSELIELEDSSGNRPLHICAITNECDCASLLLDSNCTIDSKNKKLLTPFMLAVCHNSFSMMELLLSNSNKVDLNNIDTNGNSSLHLACINGHENCALFILDHIESNSPLVNLKNTDGETALHLASSNGWLTCVEILLSKGADIWIKNKSQKTPLLSCAKNDSVSDCLELMLSRLLMAAQTPMKHHHKLNNNYPISNPSSTTKNMMMIMMMSNAAAAAAASQHQTPINNNKNATYNLNSINKHLNDSLCLLANSDIILNDVHMNQLSDSMDENHNSKIDDIKKDLTDNIMNSTTKNNNEIMMNSNNNNLNSTLILNDGDNGGNGSGGGSGAAGCGSVGSGLGSIENLDTLNGCYLNLNTSNDFLKQQSSFDFDLIESANMKLNSYSSNNNVNNNSNHNNDNNHNQNDPNSKILQSNSLSSFDSEFY